MSGLPLSNRRPVEIVEFEFGGVRFRGGFGAPGRETAGARLRRRLAGALVGGAFAGPAEVWLTPDVKEGSSYHAIAQDLAIAASLALRHGCPLAELEASLSKTADGSPAGPLGALLVAMWPARTGTGTTLAPGSTIPPALGAATLTGEACDHCGAFAMARSPSGRACRACGKAAPDAL